MKVSTLLFRPILPFIISNISLKIGKIPEILFQLYRKHFFISENFWHLENNLVYCPLIIWETIVPTHNNFDIKKLNYKIGKPSFMKSLDVESCLNQEISSSYQGIDQKVKYKRRDCKFAGWPGLWQKLRWILFIWT